jgi:hypothetical protein
MTTPFLTAVEQAHVIAATLREVAVERVRQNARWGEQNHPDGTGGEREIHRALAAKADCDAAFRHGGGTWRYILAEEVAEAFAESDPAALRAELLQIAAVAAAWVEAIDRRESR